MLWNNKKYERYLGNILDRRILNDCFFRFRQEYHLLHKFLNADSKYANI